MSRVPTDLLAAPGDLLGVLEAVVVVDRDGHERHRNERAGELLGDVALQELLTEESRSKLAGVLVRPRTGVELVTVDGAVWDVSAGAHGEDVVLVLRDVSRYTAAAAKLAVVTDQLARRNRDLSALYEVSAQLSSTLNLAELGDVTCQLVGEYIGARAVTVVVGDHRYCWPSSAPAEEPDGSLPLAMTQTDEGMLRWWRAGRLDAAERRLMSLIVSRAALGFDNAVLHAATARQAEHDALTGLLNRAGLRRLLATTVLPAAVVLLDLDHFKAVNDRHGHEAGDEVLVRVAETFRTVRSTEIPARWGGEEFLLLFPATSVPDAVAAVDRLRERVVASVHVHGDPVTFSAGVAGVGAVDGFDRAVAAADAALYAAKSAGRNRVLAA